MQGFVQSYYAQLQDLKASERVMYYFAAERLPVLTTLTREYAVFNRWFSSVPANGAIPNRAFASFGTSFGGVTPEIKYQPEKYASIFERMVRAGRTAKLYAYDSYSSLVDLPYLIGNKKELLSYYAQFLADCRTGLLPDYSFVEPNHSDHASDDGEEVASDQQIDHNVQAGELFIASVYNAIRENPNLWESTALLIVYDCHGGIYDHVPPPNCVPDEFQDHSAGYIFDRFGVRVPAILISPWIPKGTVVNRIFEHASIPATVCKQFIGREEVRPPREMVADTFLDLFTLSAPRADAITFSLGGDQPRSRPGRISAVVQSLGIQAGAASSEEPISNLLLTQIRRLHEREQTLPEDKRTGIDINEIKTEVAALAALAAGSGKGGMRTEVEEREGKRPEAA
jgi:phospholipase C